MSKKNDILIPTKISNMEPLMPSIDSVLMNLSMSIYERIGHLRGMLNKITAFELSKLLVDMNSYYSNLIEGHKTYPKDVERALHNDFSKKPDERKKQYLGKALVLTEQEILSIANKDNVFSEEFILNIHKVFYDNLPKEFHSSKSKLGKSYKIEAGKFRNFEVSVGEHQPPSYKTLEKFLKRFCKFYKSVSIGEMLIGVAALHHRLTWIHPFGDGNGRVIRIYTNAILKAFDLDGLGIWSISRGLARNKVAYFANLAKADSDRHSSLDGRGSLSNKGLQDFCIFFLQIMLDQIEFMLNSLKLDTISQRYARLLSDIFPKNADIYIRIVREIWLMGEVNRGQVAQITGKSERTSRTMISNLEEKNLIKSLTPKGALRINFNVDISEHIFPNLYINFD